MSIDATFRAKLRQRLDDEIARSTAMVMTGQCADHSEYRYSCGYVKAMTDVAAIMTEIETDLQKG